MTEKKGAKGLIRFDGLYGDKDAQPDSEYVFAELLETRSRLFDWKIPPHIHPDLFQLFFIESGSLVFTDAGGEHAMKSPCALLVPPAALHGFHYRPGASGRIITLSAALMNKLFEDTSPVNDMLVLVQRMDVFPDEHAAMELLTVMRQIEEELFNTLPEKRLMLHNYIRQLLVLLYRLWQHNQVMVSGADNRQLACFRQLQQRIRQVGTTSTIAQLAAEMAVTPTHLNRICKLVSGKAANQLLQEHVLEEAKKYLGYSSYSISEIAYLLHFEYPNYFARFFKKHTGISPSQFRQNHYNG